MTRNRRHAQSGSTLMLMPAAVLILFVLGSIAVDAAIVYLQQREAYNVAADAANDAAAAGPSELGLRDGDGAGPSLRLDPGHARATAAATIGRSGIEVDHASVTVRGADTVVVELTVPVDYLLRPVIPGATGSGHVTVRAVALTETR